MTICHRINSNLPAMGCKNSRLGEVCTASSTSLSEAFDLPAPSTSEDDESVVKNARLTSFNATLRSKEDCDSREPTFVAGCLTSASATVPDSPTLLTRLLSAGTSIGLGKSSNLHCSSSSSSSRTYRLTWHKLQ